MRGVKFDGPLHAESLNVDGNLFMESEAQQNTNFKTVDLVGANIAGNIFMIGASFDGALIAGMLKGGGKSVHGVHYRR